MKLKIEINCREHSSVFRLADIPFKVESRWFAGSCNINTYELEELIGSKMRALYQRKKGRDLFDIWFFLENHNLKTSKIADAFKKIMRADGHSITKKDFRENMSKKLNDIDFTGDVMGLLNTKIKFNAHEAWAQVDDKIINLI